MTRKNLLIIIFAIVIIFMFIIFGFNKKEDDAIINTPTTKVSGNTVYNAVLDESTGEVKYKLYDKETGRDKEITADESAVQIYMDDPDFVGAENDNYTSQDPIEYNEDGSVKLNEMENE